MKDDECPYTCIETILAQLGDPLVVEPLNSKDGRCCSKVKIQVEKHKNVAPTMKRDLIINFELS